MTKFQNNISSLLIALSAIFVLQSSAIAQDVGPLQGEWQLSVFKYYGASEPFLPPSNVFEFSETVAFTAQNTPAVGAPLCTMSGNRIGTMLSGSEICGLPRNSFGAFMGIIDSSTRPRNMYLVWADSKGIYLIRGGKLPN